MEAVRFALIFALLTPFAAAQEATADRDRVFASYGHLKTLAGVGDEMIRISGRVLLKERRVARWNCRIRT